MGTLAEPAFPDDRGDVDPDLAIALDSYSSDHKLEPVLGALSAARILVPVIALLGASPADGDKDADMAAVLMTGADGRTALLAFSSLATMLTWDPTSRPVPLLATHAARAALDEGASALVLDVAGPTLAVIETDDLGHLAEGHTLARTSAGYAWVTA
ncbi:hypothetical protein BH09ACT10_BH09ACT10_09520 [soil metagenome]